MLDDVYLLTFEMVKIYLFENVTNEHFENVPKSWKSYNLNSELLQCDYRPWKQFLKDHTNIHAEIASDLVIFLSKCKRFIFLPQFSQIAKVFTAYIPALSTDGRMLGNLRRLKSYLDKQDWAVSQ